MRFVFALTFLILASTLAGPVGPDVARADRLSPTPFTFASGPVSGEAMATDGTYAYLVGGVSSSGQVLDTVWRISITSGTVELMSLRLPFAVKNAAAATDFIPNDGSCPYIGLCLIIAGGTKADGSLSNKVWAYHKSENYPVEHITEHMTLPQARTEMGYAYGYSYAAADQVLFMAGGRTAAGLSRDVLFLDTDSRSIPFTQQLPTARRFSAVYHLSNQFLVLGGSTASGPTNENLGFSGEGTWTEAPLPTPTSGAVAFDGNQPTYFKNCGGNGCPWLVLVGGEGQSDSQAGVPNSRLVQGYDYFDDVWYELGRAGPSTEFSGRTAFSRYETDRYVGYLYGSKNPGSGTAHNVVHKYDSSAPGSPSPPRNLVASADGVGRITLTWDHPIHHQNSQTFRIYRDAESQRHNPTATPHATFTGWGGTWSDSGLGPGESHTYSVSLATSGGESFWSRSASAQTWSAPSAPRSVSAQPGPANGQIQVGWAEPSSNGGSPITGYKLYRTDVGLLQTLPATARSYTDGGLGDGVTKTYRLAAESAVGEGPSVQVSARTFQAPGPPKNLRAVSGSAPGTIQLTWQSPDDTGGRPITNYIVYRSLESGQPAYLTTLGNVLSYVDSPKTALGLPDLLHPYHYYVRAVTVFGQGPLLSNEACAWPGPAVPIDRGCSPLPLVD